MAKIKLEDIVEHLDSEIKRALDYAVKHTLPDAEFNKQTLYRKFVRGIERYSSTWENVPDHCV